MTVAEATGGRFVITDGAARMLTMIAMDKYKNDPIFRAEADAIRAEIEIKRQEKEVSESEV